MWRTPIPPISGRDLAELTFDRRSYEANINVIGATRRMLQRTIDILKA
jgi:flagellar basal-body rod protein FlgC